MNLFNQVSTNLVTELILNLGDPFAAGSCETRLRTFSGFSIIGPLSCHLLTRTAGTAAFLAVRFRPGGMAPFFNVPSYELTDRIADMETFWGTFGKQTEQQVRESGRQYGRGARCRRSRRISKHDQPIAGEAGKHVRRVLAAGRLHRSVHL